MNVRTYFTVFAVLSVLFGAGFVIAPGAVLANYGIAATPAVAVMSRLFGGTLIALAVILWMARDFDSVAARAVLLGLLGADTINLVVSIAGTVAGTINVLGWSTVLIYLAGALGAGYFLMNPSKS